MHTLRIPFILALVLISSLAAQNGKIPWTVDDIVMQHGAGGWTLSRDGRRALWVKRTADKEKDRFVSTLMLCDLATGKSRPLTAGKSGFSSARFSPDGKKVGFLSGRDFPSGMKGLDKKKKGSQLWILDLAGGEARPETKIPYGISSWQWITEDLVYLTTRERKTRAEAQNEKDKDDTVVVEDLQRFRDRRRRLFRYELGKKTLRRVGETMDSISSFAASPDGRYVVAMHAVDPRHRAESNQPPRCRLHDLQAGEVHELFADRKNKPRGFAWSLDGQGFYVRYPESSVDGETWGAITVLKWVDAKTRAVSDIPLEWERGLAGSLAVTADGFMAAMQKGTRVEMRRYVRSGGAWSSRPLEGPHAARISSLYKARDADRVIYVHGSASDPDHVVTAKLDGARLLEEKEIHRPAGGFAKKPIAETAVIRWKGALDQEVEGILYYPHEWTAGERRPLVLITHGGPHAADRDRFSERWANSPNLYCQRGAFVLKTNYHGSAGYGLAFGESIKGRYYELELKDMFAGIQKLIDEGKVDPERMGLVGWSNGAILSVAALTLAHLYAPEYDFSFKACAPGAGDVNWTSDYGNCAFGASFDDFYLGGPPWEIPHKYLEKSPLFHVERVTTPTIIFFGDKDTSVPTEQGWEWYRALSRVGKAPVRYLLFPGQPHGLGKLTHQRRKLKEELAWMDRYLFEKTPEDTRLVRDGSPLDLAQSAGSFARDGDFFGVRHGGYLVPETVRVGTFEVGRFEVTRAQWASYQGQAVPATAIGNYPMTDVMAPLAKAYVEWMREITDEPWRLMTEAEMKGLAGAAGPAENTLEHWVGFKPTLEEAAKLSPRIKALGWQRVLRPAGASRPGVKKFGAVRNHLFDLGGNVAEYVLDEKGKIVVRGSCAVLAKDDRAESQAPGLSWTGLRVAKGPPSKPKDKKKVEGK